MVLMVFIIIFLFIPPKFSFIDLYPIPSYLIPFHWLMQDLREKFREKLVKMKY